jgi:hypothetical protein
MTSPIRVLRGLAPAALALFTLGADAERPRVANTPPVPKFAPPATGVLFADDFSNGLARWETPEPHVWTTQRGTLRADLPDQKQLRSFLYAGDESWTNYALDLDVCMMRGVDKGAAVHVRGNSGVAVDLRGPGYQDVVMYRREWPLGKASAVNANGAWNHLRIEAQNGRYRVYVNGELKLQHVDKRARSAEPAAGRIALPAYTGGGGQCTVFYDNLVVTALP